MDEKQLEVIRVEISKLALKENDYLVMKFPDFLTRSGVEHIAETLLEKYPDLADKIIILAGGIELYVVEK